MISIHHIAHLRQVSQLIISDFSGETFKGVEMLYFSMSATTTQLFSSSCIVDGYCCCVVDKQCFFSWKIVVCNALTL